MRNPLLIPELRELLREGRDDALREVLSDLHPNDAASILSGLDDDEIVRVMTMLPLEAERDVFFYLDPEIQEGIVLGSGRNRVRALLTAMHSDDRAEFFDQLDERVRQRITPLLEKAAREDLLRRERYEDDQVGAILAIEHCVLKSDLTAAQAMAELRRQEPSRETIYYAYVVDDDGKLLGYVSLRDLVMASDDERIDDLMKPEPVAVAVDADREEAARLIREYDVLALPVVDERHRLVGIITHDDAADILEEEDTEDIEKMAGLSGEAEARGYMDESVSSQLVRRLPVVAFLAMFYVFTAKFIAGHEGDLEESSGSEGLDSTLIALLPMVMATGGMVGTQASSVVIRALTVGDLVPSACLRVLWKEVRISLGLAFCLSTIVFFEGYMIGQPHDLLLTACLAMALAMALHVVTAALLGSMIPLVAKALGRDPAMVSTPAVTGIADLSGAVIYMVVVLTMLERGF